MSRFSQLSKRLGISGIAFVVFLILFSLFYFTGNDMMVLLTTLCLIPLTGIVLYRILRWIQLHALWSVRNRLLFVYWLMGVLPLFLLLVLVGVGAWAFTTELAIYLATSALDRRVDGINQAMHWLDGMSPAQRSTAAADIQRAVSHEFPNFRLYIRDQNGYHKYPGDCPDLLMPPGWKNSNGLLVLGHRFYGWAHVLDQGVEITGLAPLSKGMVAGLVPNLGKIGLAEQYHSGRNAGRQVETLAPDDDKNQGAPSQLPPAMNRFDVPLFWAASVSHSHLEDPNRGFDSVLYIESRPSAVFSAVFGKAESFRGVLFLIFVGLAVLFLIVEVVAIVIGVRLSGRLTGAVNQLYEGTRRVIRGDFQHRIAANHHDQLGELAVSFNQMTSNLERLVVIERERAPADRNRNRARSSKPALSKRRAPNARAPIDGSLRSRPAGLRRLLRLHGSRSTSTCLCHRGCGRQRYLGRLVDGDFASCSARANGELRSRKAFHGFSPRRLAVKRPNLRPHCARKVRHVLLRAIRSAIARLDLHQCRTSLSAAVAER